MKKIYAPWRYGYVSETVKNTNKKKLKNECVFCQAFSDNKDKENLILKRYKNCVIVMNKYPYNAGHLMVLPIEHEGELCELDQETRTEAMELVNITINALKKTLNPDGFNVGINMGSAGGGGIPSHLHIHVLPRWNGDTNFLATTGDTKVICEEFSEVYDKLKQALE